MVDTKEAVKHTFKNRYGDKCQLSRLTTLGSCGEDPCRMNALA